MAPRQDRLVAFLLILWCLLILPNGSETTVHPRRRLSAAKGISLSALRQRAHSNASEPTRGHNKSASATVRTYTIPPSAIQHLVFSGDMPDQQDSQEHMPDALEQQYGDLKRILLEGRNRTEVQSGQELDRKLEQLIELQSAAEAKTQPASDAVPKAVTPANATVAGPSESTCVKEENGLVVANFTLPDETLATFLSAVQQACARPASTVTRKAPKPIAHVSPTVFPACALQRRVSTAFKENWRRMTELWKQLVPASVAPPPLMADIHALRQFTEMEDGASRAWFSLFSASIHPFLAVKHHVAAATASRLINDFLYLLHQYERMMQLMPPSYMTEAVVNKLRQAISTAMNETSTQAWEQIHTPLEHDIAQHMFAALFGSSFTAADFERQGDAPSAFEKEFPLLHNELIELRELVAEPVVHGKSNIPYQQVLLRHYPLVSEITCLARWHSIYVKTYKAYADAYDTLFDGVATSERPSRLDQALSLANHQPKQEDEKEVLERVVNKPFGDALLPNLRDDIIAFQIDQRHADIVLIPDELYEFDAYYSALSLAAEKSYRDFAVRHHKPISVFTQTWLEIRKAIVDAISDGVQMDLLNNQVRLVFSPAFDDEEMQQMVDTSVQLNRACAVAWDARFPEQELSAGRTVVFGLRQAREARALAQALEAKTQREAEERKREALVREILAEEEAEKEKSQRKKKKPKAAQTRKSEKKEVKRKEEEEKANTEQEATQKAAEPKKELQERKEEEMKDTDGSAEPFQVITSRRRPYPQQRRKESIQRKRESLGKDLPSFPPDPSPRGRPRGMARESQAAPSLADTVRQNVHMGTFAPVSSKPATPVATLHAASKEPSLKSRAPVSVPAQASLRERIIPPVVASTAMRRERSMSLQSVYSASGVSVSPSVLTESTDPSSFASDSPLTAFHAQEEAHKPMLMATTTSQDEISDALEQLQCHINDDDDDTWPLQQGMQSVSLSIPHNGPYTPIPSRPPWLQPESYMSPSHSPSRPVYMSRQPSSEVSHSSRSSSSFASSFPSMPLDRSYSSFAPAPAHYVSTPPQLGHGAIPSPYFSAPSSHYYFPSSRSYSPMHYSAAQFAPPGLSYTPPPNPYPPSPPAILNDPRFSQPAGYWDTEELARVVETRAMLARVAEVTRVYHEIAQFQHEPGLASFSANGISEHVENAFQDLFQPERATLVREETLAEEEEEEEEDDDDDDVEIIGLKHQPIPFLLHSA